MTYKVGVNLEEGLPVSPIAGAGTSLAALIGNFQKGQVNKAVLVNNMTEFETLYGNVPVSGSNSYYAVKAFFAKVGETPLYILRIASSLAAKATKILQDKNTSPVNTLQVYAKTEGT